MDLEKQYRNKLINSPVLTVYPKSADVRSLAEILCLSLGKYIKKSVKIFDSKDNKFKNIQINWNFNAMDSPERNSWGDTSVKNFLCETCQIQKNDIKTNVCGMCYYNKSNENKLYHTCHESTQARLNYGYSIPWVVTTLKEYNLLNYIDMVYNSYICWDHSLSNFAQQICNTVLLTVHKSERSKMGSHWRDITKNKDIWVNQNGLLSKLNQKDLHSCLKYLYFVIQRIESLKDETKLKNALYDILLWISIHECYFGLKESKQYNFVQIVEDAVKGIDYIKSRLPKQQLITHVTTHQITGQLLTSVLIQKYPIKTFRTAVLELYVYIIVFVMFEFVSNLFEFVSNLFENCLKNVWFFNFV